MDLHIYDAHTSAFDKYMPIALYLFTCGIHGLLLYAYEPFPYMYIYVRLLVFCRGFSVGWDNVQKNVHRKHQSRDEGNAFILKSMAYAVGHRTPSLQKDDVERSACVDVAPDCFVPSPADWEDARVRMEAIVQRILVDQVHRHLVKCVMNMNNSLLS
jgi:hypothetical protein